MSTNALQLLREQRVAQSLNAAASNGQTKTSLQIPMKVMASTRIKAEFRRPVCKRRLLAKLNESVFSEFDKFVECLVRCPHGDQREFLLDVIQQDYKVLCERDSQKKLGRKYNMITNGSLKLFRNVGQTFCLCEGRGVPHSRCSARNIPAGRRR